jgi:DNA gyrase subunit A
VVLNNLYAADADADGVRHQHGGAGGRPAALLNLKQLLEYFLRHRRDVVTRRTIYELRKARERAHLLEGYTVALANIDEVIELIKASPSPAEAREGLMGAPGRPAPSAACWSAPAPPRPARTIWPPAFGLARRPARYRLSERRPGHPRSAAAAPHRAGAGQAPQGVRGQSSTEIADLLTSSQDPERLMQVIREELEAIREEYADERRTEIQIDQEDLTLLDLIAPEDVVVTLSHAGYVKAQPLSEYQAQRRGGKGRSAASGEGRGLHRAAVRRQLPRHAAVLLQLRQGLLAQGLPDSRGRAHLARRPMVNLLQLDEGERVTSILPVPKTTENRFIFMATSQRLREEDRPRQLRAALRGAAGHRPARGRCAGRYGRHRRRVRRDAVQQRGQGRCASTSPTVRPWGAPPRRARHQSRRTGIA